MKYLLLFILSTSFCYSQDNIVDDLSNSGETRSLSLITEKIIKISNNRKIFILSAKSNGFNSGDFISLLTDNELICRAIVAKISNLKAGIKIIKLYSAAAFNNLNPRDTVQIIRGDDSYFKNLKNKKSSELQSTINDEEDLFSEEIIDERTGDKEKKDALISTDNIISINFSNSSKVPVGSFIGASWSYQFKSNIWIEAEYNYGVAKNFPAQNASIDTAFTNIIVKAKYTFKAPAYSFLQPYVGVSIISGQSTDPTLLTKAEQDLLAAANVKSLVIGVTLLKRLVPGWFIRADVGLMGFGAGMALEF